MISGVSSSSIPTIGYAIHASQSGKTALPVSPASVIYSNFEHVQGVAAPEGVQGVAVTKLKILDVLIDRLSELKRKPQFSFDEAGPSDEQVDALIRLYQNQIRSQTTAAVPYIQTPSQPTGMVFNLVA